MVELINVGIGILQLREQRATQLLAVTEHAFLAAIKYSQLDGVNALIR